MDFHQSSKHPFDFLPLLENIIAGNTIYGAHRAGVLLDKGAIFNDIYDNQVRHFRVAPFESASAHFNSVVGNGWQAEIQASDCTATSSSKQTVVIWSALLLGLLLALMVAGYAMRRAKI